MDINKYTIIIMYLVIYIVFVYGDRMNHIIMQFHIQELLCRDIRCLIWYRSNVSRCEEETIQFYAKITYQDVCYKSL